MTPPPMGRQAAEDQAAARAAVEQRGREAGDVLAQGQGLPERVELQRERC